MSRFDVVVVGEALVELSSAAPLEHAELMTLSVSGDAVNAAAAAAAAGASVALLTRVGDDELGTRIVTFCDERGIDTSLVRRVAAPNGLYFVAADPAGTREFVYHRRASAATGLTAQDVDVAGVASARALVVSGVTQALSPSCAAAVLHAAQAVSAAGGTVVYDPNFRRRLTTPEAAAAALAVVAGYATLVTPSCPGDAGALLGTVDPVEAAAACRRLGARAAAVTRGPEGVLLDAGAGPVEVPPLPAPRVVDATGAGDVFAGTTAARLALGDALLDAVALGASAAALSLAGQGGTGALASLERARAHLDAATSDAGGLR
jgi:2-dehydro-3-deoxygluconokinase